MKKIALFGASGKSGQHFLTQALAKGYEVKALVRQPSKITTKHKALEIIQGDVLSAEKVSETIAGCDVVVSLFGQVKGSPAWVQSEGTAHIVAAMKQHGLGRIISLSGGGLPYPEKDQPKFADKLIRGIMRLAVPQILRDAARHHEVLRDSGLAWTIVRAPRLTQEAARGQYRVGWVGVNASTSIGRADLATFILSLVEDTQYDGQMPFVSY